MRSSVSQSRAFEPAASNRNMRNNEAPQNKKTNNKNSSFAGKNKEEFDSFTRQKQIDLILDKISKSGYESLTQLEKDFLFRAGK